jgi:hypothetical protein
VTPEDAQALMRWNLRHGNAESTGRAMAMVGGQDQDPAGFRDWYGAVSNKLGISPDPDDPEHHYDYRAFYDAMKRGEAISPDQPGGHFPSTYKTEGHPRTYLDDPTTGKVFDTRSAEYLAGGPVPQRALTASEQSPDKPDFDPDRARAIAKGLGALRFIR